MVVSSLHETMTHDGRSLVVSSAQFIREIISTAMHAVYFLLALVVDWDVVPGLAHAVRQKTAQLRGRRRGQYGYQQLPDGAGRWTQDSSKH